MRRIDERLLPDSVGDIVEEIGLAATLKLVERWGGARVWIPESVTSEHPLALALGLSAARALCKRFAVGDLTVPRCAAAMTALRDREIRARYAAGETAAALAAAFAVTERRIWQIIAQPSR